MLSLFRRGFHARCTLLNQGSAFDQITRVNRGLDKPLVNDLPAAVRLAARCSVALLFFSTDQNGRCEFSAGTAAVSRVGSGRSSGSSSFKSLFINGPDTAKGDASTLSKYSGRLNDRELVNKMLTKHVTGFDRFMELFSTHPNMVKRLQTLQRIQ